MELAEKFVAFAEAGNQQRFTTQDGRVLQGWIMEITESALLISTGVGEQGNDVWVSLLDVLPESLAYWDSRTQQWQAFSLI